MHNNNVHTKFVSIRVIKKDGLGNTFPVQTCTFSCKFNFNDKQTSSDWIIKIELTKANYLRACPVIR